MPSKLLELEFLLLLAIHSHCQVDSVNEYEKLKLFQLNIVKEPLERSEPVEGEASGMESFDFFSLFCHQKKAERANKNKGN